MTTLDQALDLIALEISKRDTLNAMQLFSELMSRTLTNIGKNEAKESVSEAEFLANIASNATLNLARHTKCTCILHTVFEPVTTMIKRLGIDDHIGFVPAMNKMLEDHEKAAPKSKPEGESEPTIPDALEELMLMKFLKIIESNIDQEPKGKQRFS